MQCFRRLLPGRSHDTSDLSDPPPRDPQLRSDYTSRCHTDRLDRHGGVVRPGAPWYGGSGRSGTERAAPQLDPLVVCSDWELGDVRDMATYPCTDSPA